MRNALTIDVEDYFQVSAFEHVIDRSDWEKFECRVVGNTSVILDTLAEFDCKATFFVLGWVAKRYPDLVRRIHREGHEVGCHGYDHRLVYHQTQEEFRRDVRRSKHAIEDLIGGAVHGYRAPSYSVTSRSLWALTILAEEGLAYDTSIFPISHHRYGIPGGLRFPHRVELPGGMSITEFPPSTLRLLGRNLPVAGGGYLRVLPISLLNYAIRRINAKGEPAMVYFHPWELDPGQSKQRVGLRTRFTHYVNLTTTEEKVRELLEEFWFGPAMQVLAEYKLAGLDGSEKLPDVCLGARTAGALGA